MGTGLYRDKDRNKRGRSERRSTGMGTVKRKKGEDRKTPAFARERINDYGTN
jgi:hypothetical protein